MTVALVVTGDEAVAYVCDADDEVWLRGRGSSPPPASPSVRRT